MLSGLTPECSQLLRYRAAYSDPFLLLCRFLELWTQHVNSSSDSTKAGDLTPPCVVGPEASNGSKALQVCQQEYMQELFADVVSFAGVYWSSGWLGLVWGSLQLWDGPLGRKCTVAVVSVVQSRLPDSSAAAVTAPVFIVGTASYRHTAAVQ